MCPTPVSDDFDMIFGAADGTDDEAVKSRLAISPPKLRSASSLKNSSTASVPTVEMIGRAEDDQVDYELESSSEQINETPRKKANLTSSTSQVDSEETPKKSTSIETGDLESVTITPAKASELLQNILSRRPPKLSVAAPVPTRNASATAMPSTSKKSSADESSSKTVAADVKSSVTKTSSSSKRTLSEATEQSSSSKKSKQKEPEQVVKDKETTSKPAVESEKKANEPTPVGYAKQNYDKYHVQAIEKKRLADTLRDGKELPVYLKAMSLYALAYTHYELFGLDALEKWKGLVEFSQQIEKKCHGYKNEITLGLCSALIAWSHQCMIQILLKSAQQISVPAIDSLASKQTSPNAAQISAALPLALTQISLHHEMVKQSWMKAVNLVPSISKYGFCIYSPVEDLVKTIDRYI